MIKELKHWFTYNVLFQFFIWYANRILGYNRLVIHTSKNGEFVIGITFGDTKERKNANR